MRERSALNLTAQGPELVEREYESLKLSVGTLREIISLLYIVKEFALLT